MQTWGPEFSHNYTYTYGSQDDQLEEIRVNDDTINYTYDSVDRLTSKAVSATGINLQQLYYYNDGEYMTNQISGLYVKLNNVTSKMFGYTYDAIGNITQITVGNSTESAYEYDAQGQLKSETIASQNLKYVYTYDNYGNIQTVTKKNLSTNAVIDTYNYTYGNSQWKDRLTAFNGTGITYDNIGNPLSYFNGSSYTFTWQKGRELASAQKNGVTTTYTYGADGLRISKSSGYEFFYSDGRLVRQLWADGEVLDFLYDESGTPYAMQYYDTMYYYVKNLQGDVVAIADANGTIVVNYAYDAWGNILSITDGSGNDISNNTWHIGNLNPIRYRSYYYDTETGFYYLQSRYYDPAIRRFINADGYVNANGDILGFNMYAYCGNNPVMYSDPTGNCRTIKFLWFTYKKDCGNCLCESSNKYIPSAKLIGTYNDGKCSLYVISQEDESKAKKLSKKKFGVINSKILFVVDMRDSDDPNMKLLNSYQIDDSETQRQIARLMLQYNEVNPTGKAWKRTEDSIVDEWNLHNFAYSWRIKRERTADCDFNNADEGMGFWDFVGR